MRELTIEQKAKAYDEALKVAEKYHNGTLKDVMETIFPELAESEDERIRKALISFLKSPFVNESITDEKVTPWIAWLEKQGGQKPKFRIGDIIKKESTGDIVTICEIDLKNREYRLSNTGFIPFKYEYLWELVEQKPAEWSEEDVGKAALTIRYLDIAKNYQTSIGSDYIDGCIDWLKSLKDRVQPQPKQEWSKEDEFHFKSIESTIEYCKKEVAENDDARYLYNEDLNWFKSLKDRVFPIPQQEWSEEDEENFKGVMDALNFCNHEGVNPYDIDPLYLASWLKSLRPQS